MKFQIKSLLSKYTNKWDAPVLLIATSFVRNEATQCYATVGLMLKCLPLVLQNAIIN